MGKAIVLTDIKVESPIKKITVVPEPTELDINYKKYMTRSGRSATPQLLNMVKELDDNGLFSIMNEFYYLANPTNSVDAAKFNIVDGGDTKLDVVGAPNITPTGYKSSSANWFRTKPANLYLGFLCVITVSDIVTPAFPAFEWGNNYSTFSFNWPNSYAAIGDYRIHGSDVEGIDKKTSHIFHHNGGIRFNYRLRNFSKTVDSNINGNNVPFGIGRRNIGADEASGSTFKFFASWNIAVNETQILKIKEIFEKYEVLL
ncbi:hypothetical protein [Chryseobacterium sp.]|uniref:hypothetical protein n=1 Tax=Chryseobacterium sp. TaxID=1871047 RepID=UPI002615E08A|nr:hypothetical protein [Chryseobacterium sp.]